MTERDILTGLTQEEEDRLLGMDEDLTLGGSLSSSSTPLSPPSIPVTTTESVPVLSTVSIANPLPVPISTRIAAYPFVQLASMASCPGAPEVQQAQEVPCPTEVAPTEPVAAESRPRSDSVLDDREILVVEESHSLTSAGSSSKEVKHYYRKCTLKWCENQVTRPRRHVLCQHMPWYFAAYTACWRCKIQVGDAREIRRTHSELSNEHPSGPNFTEFEARLWTCLGNGLLHFFRQVLGLPSLQALLTYVQDHRLYPQDGTPPGGDFSPQEQLLLEMYEELHFSHLVGRPQPYTVHPPDCVASLLHWGVILRLMDFLDPQDQIWVSGLYHPCLADGSPMPPYFPSGQQPLEFIDAHFHLDDMIARGVCTSLTNLERQLKESDSFRFVQGVANYIHPDSWNHIPHQPAQDSRIVYTVGVHPKHSGNALSNGLARVCFNLSRHLLCSGCVGLGEIGLDYSKTNVPIQQQREVFEAQLRLEAAEGRPVVLHCRDHPRGNPGEASLEALGIMRSLGITDRNVHIHCFSGTVDTVRRWLDFYPPERVFFGFTARVMDRDQQHVAEAANRVPLCNLLLESDAPYLTPGRPHGVPNHPWTIYRTLTFLAARRGVPIPILLKICNANARVLYHLW